METSRKATFVLPEALLSEMRELVESGHITSASALVREALTSRLKEIREQRIFEHFQQAAQDPDFQADIDSTMRDFQFLDAESARLIQ